jgi:NADP-dependent 3-hydroxy acid dehydrogenase YdfG
VAEAEGVLDGRRTLVIGASQGIGRAIAARLHADGARVAASARSKDNLDALVGALGERAVALACDVREPEACTDVVAHAVDAFGGLDALIYSAGIAEFAALADATADEWRAVYETNVLGALMVTNAAIPHLRAARGHAIFVVSETTVTNPWPGLGLYASSKAALDRCIMVWNAEVPEVAFTGLVAGPTGGTEFATAKGADAMQFGKQWFRMGLMDRGTLEPEDHAHAVVAVLTSRAGIETLWVRPRP